MDNIKTKIEALKKHIIELNNRAAGCVIEGYEWTSIEIITELQAKLEESETKRVFAIKGAENFRIALNDLRELLEAESWKPISEAPKDGTKILTYRKKPKPGFHTVSEDYWMKDIYCEGGVKSGWARSAGGVDPTNYKLITPPELKG